MSVTQLSLDAWLEADARNSAPTFFARPAWALALQDVMPGFVAAPLRVEIAGKRFVLPLLRATDGRIRFANYQGFPLGTYTCVLDERTMTPADATDTLAVIETIARRADTLQLVLWPLGPRPAGDRFAAHQYETAVIDCSPGFDSVLRGVRGVTRRMAEQATRRGVICARAPVSDLERYYALLESASRGWGLSQPPISLPLLRAVFQRAGDAAQLWFAYLDDLPIGGGIVLLGASELFFWSAAMNRDYSRYRPSNALNLALLDYTCSQGLRWYNLGANEGLEGVARFKHDLGAVPISYPLLHHHRVRYAVYDRLRAVFSPARVGKHPIC